MHFIKVHKSHRIVVAICDSDLIGKKFEEGKRQLDLRENFYKGEEIETGKLIKSLQHYLIEDATFNIVGKSSVKAAIDARIISKTNIDKIQGIPFTLILL